MAIESSQRDVFVGAHLTEEAKEQLKSEANRRKMSMSALLAQIVDIFLETAHEEELGQIRSNKRSFTEEEPPLPFMTEEVK